MAINTIPPSEDHPFNVHEAGVIDGDSDDVYSTREWTSSKGLTRWTYFLLGCAILLPFSALTNGTPFFLSRLVDSPFYSTFSSCLSSVYTLVKLFGIFYCTITLKQSSPSRRIFVSIITTSLLIISLCLSTFVRGTPSAFLSYALFNAASVAVLSSYLCVAVYAQAAPLGPSFLQSVLSGQGAIAVAISVVQVVSAIISLWGFSPQSTVSVVMKGGGRDNQAEDMAARIFFGVSALFLCTTLVAYTWLTRQASHKSVTGAVEQQSDVEEADEFTGLVSDDYRRISTEVDSRVYQIFKQNWVFMISIAYVYAVTLAVYPAITVRVQSINPAIPALLFTAVHFLVFTTGDLIGRHTCSFPRFLVWSAKKIFAMSLIRTLFIPLILLCNFYRPTTTSSVSPVVNSDILFMIILFTVGYTNGFLSCLALLVVSSLERNPKLEGRREDVDVAATLGGTFMMVGLASGALASFGVQALI